MVYNCYRIAEVFVEVGAKVFIYVKLNCTVANYPTFDIHIYNSYKYIYIYIRENFNLKHLKTKLYQIYTRREYRWNILALWRIPRLFSYQKKKKKLNICINVIIISLFVKIIQWKYHAYLKIFMWQTCRYSIWNKNNYFTSIYFEVKF